MPKSIAPQNLIKQSSEILTFVMDFSNVLASDETITTIVSVLSELRGGGTSNLTVSSGTIVGKTVSMVISGGTRAQTYRIEVIITSSGGSTIEGDGLLKISN